MTDSTVDEMPVTTAPAEAPSLIDQLKELAVRVVSKFADYEQKIAAAAAAPAASPDELAAANERAAIAEAKAQQLQATLDQLKAQDAAEDSGISDVMSQLSAALAE